VPALLSQKKGGGEGQTTDTGRSSDASLAEKRNLLYTFWKTHILSFTPSLRGANIQLYQRKVCSPHPASSKKRKQKTNNLQIN